MCPNLSYIDVYTVLIFITFFLTDDFAEEEEVQSFGYKRFGKLDNTFKFCHIDKTISQMNSLYMLLETWSKL